MFLESHLALVAEIKDPDTSRKFSWRLYAEAEAIFV